MPTASNALLRYEAGQTAVAMSALSDAGDHTNFAGSASPWSKRSGFTPVIRPNGLVTGGAVTPSAAGTNDAVDVAAATAYIGGALISAAASTDEAVARTTSGYLLLTLAEAAYVAAVAGDIGKTVSGGTTGDTATLVAYNNATRQWLVAQVDGGDAFDDDDEAITIGTGTGAGSMDGVAVVPGYKINSIVITSGGAVEVTEGYPALAFSETRGALGGPPLIATTSVEVAQVRYSAAASADVATREIFSVLGVHQERFDYPTYQIDYYNGKVIFDAALSLNHTGGVAKKIYASYASPIFADVSIANDFVPPENSISVSSQQAYGRTLGGKSSSLGQGSFTAYLNDGVTDALVTLAGQDLWFKFYPDRYQGPYIMSQGTLGMARQFPAGSNIMATCTISAESAATNVAA